MKRHVLLVGLALSLCLGSGTTAMAQAPSYMNYQGRLTQSDGAPLPAGSYTLEINIYDQPTGGALVWGPYRFDGTTGNGKGPQVAVQADGRFNVIIGPNDSASRDIQSVFTGTGNRYVEMKVNGGNPILPRQQFLMAPYAARATRSDNSNNADKLGNKTPAEYAASYNGLTTYGVPAGTIVMWYSATVPAGWAECDGQSGRPDLRGRFPIGANASYPVQTSGGASTHTHSFSATSGHPSTFEGYAGAYNDSAEVGDNDHTHDISGTTGGTGHIPPYVSVKFIIKL